MRQFKKRYKLIATFSVILLLPSILAGCENDSTKSTYTAEKYNTYYLQKFGDEVMPVTGYIGPPPKFSYNGKTYESQINQQQYENIKNSGINLIYGLSEDFNKQPDEVKNALSLAQANGILYLLNDSKLFDVRKNKLSSDEDFKKRIELYKNEPAFAGLHVIDEPGTISYSIIQNVKNAFVKNFDINKNVFYVNVLPTYASVTQLEGGYGALTATRPDLDYRTYIGEYLDIVSPPFLSYDFYPMLGDTEDTRENILDDYFMNMAIIRDACEKKGIPFWTFIQSGGKWEGNDQVRIPIEGEVLWQVNMSLAYGAKGIQYFPYFQPPEWSFMENGIAGLISKNGKKNAMYFYAQKANKQIAAIDHILMKSKSMGIIQNGESPALVYALGTIEKFRQLVSYSGDDSIIGCFDHKGKTVLYVVNNSITNRKARVKLKFDDDYKLNVIQRATSVKTSGKDLILTLAAGEGALVEIN